MKDRLTMFKLVFVLTSLFALTSQAQTVPPWSKGLNDPAANRGFVFEVPDIDNVPDLHGNPVGAKLVLFIGGNQFFVLPKLISGFEKLHPELAGHIFYETLPPGVLLKQMAHGNRVTLGNLTIGIAPDIYEAGARELEKLQKDGRVEKVVPYTTNDLEIMVQSGNPMHIASLKDLARENVRASMPNPEYEGVANQIIASLKKTGGEELATQVYQSRVATGGVFLTQIHHRQTPMRILKNESDVGVVWTSEVIFQQKIGNRIEGVEIPPSENTTAVYAAGLVTNASHRSAAVAWLEYLQSDQAQAAYREFGFKSVTTHQGHE
ncbi:MAG TPA: substrate-binding domain-containing protein [Acidobacteriaceae bacterium]